MSRLLVPGHLLQETFQHFRTCGGGRRECQVLWTSPWEAPGTVTRLVHSAHHAHAGGFSLHDDWLTAFWIALAERKEGVRVQVHTHPQEAFHSATDDAYPIVQAAGLLSLVIPNFGMGRATFEACYLCEMTGAGDWREVQVEDHIAVVP